MMLDKGILQMEALTYLRGRSFSNTIFLVDEAQNINYHEAKEELLLRDLNLLNLI